MDIWLSHRKFKDCSAPTDVKVESVDLFHYEYDEEYNGICLLWYNDRTDYNNPWTGDDIVPLILPRAIKDFPVVGMAADCIRSNLKDVYYPPSFRYFKFGDKKMPIIEGHCSIPEDSIVMRDNKAYLDYYALSTSIELQSVTIPKNVTKISRHDFACCCSLRCINVDPNNPVYSDINGLLYDKEKIVLIKCPEGVEGDIAIPYGVVEIAEYAFSKCHLITRINLPDTVSIIGASAFEDCSNLKNVRRGGER